MTDPIKDFTKGNEVKGIKQFVKNMPITSVTLVVVGYLLLLTLLPKLTIVLTVFGAAGLFASHFIKDWSEEE